MITSEIGYIVLPKYLSRQDAIQEFEATGQVCVEVEGRGVFKKVEVPYSNRTDFSIVFPANNASYGSKVLVAFPGTHTNPIIVAVYGAPQSPALIKSGVWEVYRALAEGGSVRLSLNPATGEIAMESDFGDNANIRQSTSGNHSIVAKKTIARRAKTEQLTADSGSYVYSGKADVRAKEYVFNGGKNGGLVNIEVLRKNLEALNKFFDTFLQALQTTVAEPGNGANSVFQMALRTAFAQQKPASTEGLEDENVKH